MINLICLNDIPHLMLVLWLTILEKGGLKIPFKA